MSLLLWFSHCATNKDEPNVYETDDEKLRRRLSKYKMNLMGKKRKSKFNATLNLLSALYITIIAKQL